MSPNRSGRICAAIRIVCVCFVLSCTSPSQRPAPPTNTTYTFIGNGDWYKSQNWLNGAAPGDNIPASDTLIIAANATCTIPNRHPIYMQGVMFVNSSLAINTMFTVGGKLMVTPKASITTTSTITNAGTISIDSGAALIQRGSGGFLWNSPGDTITNNGTLSLNEGSFVNDGAFINQLKGITNLKVNNYSEGSLLNQGVINNDSILEAKYGNWENAGQIVCTHNASLVIDAGVTLHNSGFGGNIQMKDRSALSIQGSGTFSNDGTLTVERNASISNQGSFADYNYLKCDGNLLNLGVFYLSTAVRKRNTPDATTIMYFSDTIFNGGNFNTGGAPVKNTGGGIFINYFSGTVSGYTPDISYVITSQPGNKSIPYWGQVSFISLATGPSINYQWQVSTNSGSSWGNVPGGGPYYAQGGVLELTQPPLTFNGYQYRVMFIGSQPGNQATSNAATLTVTGGQRK